MRRILVAISILFLVMFLAACGGGGSSKTYEMEEDGMSVTMSFEHKDDTITEQTMENVIPYELMGIETKEEAEALFGMVSGEFEDVAGVSHDIKYNNDELVQTMVVDYEKAESDGAFDAGGMFFDDELSDTMSMSEMDEMLKAQGFTEK